MSMHYEFENIADAFHQMRVWEEEANAKVVDEQRSISWGSHFMRPHEQSGLIIFGHVTPEQQLIEDERSCGADEAEAQETLRSLQETHARGYRFGRHYSTVEPEGELGSTHILKCWPITEEQFGQAKELGWDARRILAEHNWLADAMIDLNNATLR